MLLKQIDADALGIKEIKAKSEYKYLNLSVVVVANNMTMLARFVCS